MHTSLGFSTYEYIRKRAVICPTRTSVRSREQRFVVLFQRCGKKNAEHTAGDYLAHADSQHEERYSTLGAVPELKYKRHDNSIRDDRRQNRDIGRASAQCVCAERTDERCGGAEAFRREVYETDKYEIELLQLVISSLKTPYICFFASI